jgi:hypothetical protein
MSHEKAMYIEWLLLMNPLESRESLKDKTIDELQAKFNLCRLEQLDEEMEEAQ